MAHLLLIIPWWAVIPGKTGAILIQQQFRPGRPAMSGVDRTSGGIRQNLTLILVMGGSNATL